MTVGAWLLVGISTLPWVVWVITYYFKNREGKK